MDKIYTVFDTETTGLSPNRGDRIIEIAAMKIIDGQLSDETFVTLINPERSLSLAAQAVNGISAEMVKDAPKMHKILPHFMDFIGGSTLVAHNAQFDIKFLKAELQKCGLSGVIPPVMCTLSLSRKFFSYQNKHNLDVVTSRFGIKIKNRHRALGDVEATAQVFLKFLEMAERADLKEID